MYRLNKKLIILCLTFLLPYTLSCQNKHIQNSLVGYWQGAFIKENSHQGINISFFNNEDNLMALQVMEEWHPVFGEFEIPVEIDSLDYVNFNSGLGKIKGKLDSNYNEFSGYVEANSPTVYIHLKKSLPPPTPDYTVSEIIFPSGNINLTGHIHQPKSRSKTAIILATGRGCYPVSTKYNLYAKILRRYGVTVLAFSKRGTGASTGDCESATIDDLAEDITAAKTYLNGLSEDYENIGILGTSAGGWVMVKAQEKTSFDFLIGIVGPATSVYDQQMQSMKYGLKEFKLSKQAEEQILEYTEMMFAAEALQANFDRFSYLLNESEKNGWQDLLEGSDIPYSIAGIDSLWVRRHNYDPQEVLKSYDQPFLGIFGEKDWVVPYKENIQRLEECFSGERRSLLNTAVAYGSAHGTETESKYVELGDNHSYWHFFRISATPMIEIIQFLRKYKFIE